MTKLQRFLPREEQVAMGWMDEQGQLNPAFKTPEQGAATSVWAAVGPELVLGVNAIRGNPGGRPNRTVRLWKDRDHFDLIRTRMRWPM